MTWKWIQKCLEEERDWWEEEEEGAEASGVDVVKYIIHWDETAVMLSASMYNEEM